MSNTEKPHEPALTAAQQAVLAAVDRIMSALARLLIRYGIPFSTFARTAKRSVARVARDEFRIEGRKPSASRISMLTGIPRKEIGQLLAEASPDDLGARMRTNRGANIIAGWGRDPDFANKRGKPASLPFDGAAHSFTELVKRYGSDVPARAALDELLRIGAVERLKGGTLHLMTDGYVPARNAELDVVGILGSDVRDLISTILHNLGASRQDRLFQRKVAYESLPATEAKRLRTFVAERGLDLLQTLNAEMARCDDSAVEEPEQSRKRFMVGLYCYEETVTDGESDNN